MSSEKWHLGKTIDLTHVLTTMSMVGFIFLSWNKMDQRMTIMEVTQHNLSEQQARDREDSKGLLKEMREDIKHILEKLRD